MYARGEDWAGGEGGRERGHKNTGRDQGLILGRGSKIKAGLAEFGEPSAVSRAGVRRPGVCVQLCCCGVFEVGLE